MSVSDERIEAAWHAIRMDKENWNCGVDPCDKEDDGYESCACWRHARAALEADAPALEAARAEGMRGRWRTICDLETVLRRIRDFVEDEHERRDVVGIDEASDYATEPEKIMAIIDAELGSIAIDARISEMKEANS